MYMYYFSHGPVSSDTRFVDQQI